MNKWCHRLHFSPARLDPRCRRSRRPRHVTAARASWRELLGCEPRRVVDPDGERRGRPDPGAARHDSPRHRVGQPYRPGAQPRGVRAGRSCMTMSTRSGQPRPGGAPVTPGSVWSTLCDLVLDKPAPPGGHRGARAQLWPHPGPAAANAPVDVDERAGDSPRDRRFLRHGGDRRPGVAGSRAPSRPSH